MRVSHDRRDPFTAYVIDVSRHGNRLRVIDELDVEWDVPDACVIVKNIILDDMVARSKNKHTGKPSDTYGFPSRIYHALVRNHFIQNGSIDVHLLQEAVDDGSIWNIDGIGEVSVRIICAWLIVHQGTSAAEVQ